MLPRSIPAMGFTLGLAAAGPAASQIPSCDASIDARESHRAIDCYRQKRFIDQFRVQDLVALDVLQRDPLAYKGKIVGVFTWFGRMVAENEAVFVEPSEKRAPAISVEDVPSTLFRADSAVVLAIEITGGKGNLVAGRYVGQYWCQQRYCADFR